MANEISMFDAVTRVAEVWPRSGFLSCPDGNDSSPSLKLYQDHYYCYHCQKNGDGVALVAWFENRTVADVLREVSGDIDPVRGTTPSLRREIVGTVSKAVTDTLRDTHNRVFDTVWVVYCNEATEVFVEELTRMTEQYDLLTAELFGFELDDDPMGGRNAMRAITRWEAEQMRYLENAHDRLWGYPLADAVADREEARK